MPMASWIAWLNRLHALAGDAGAAGVRVADQGVAGGQHVDGVAGQRRQRVRHRRDDADDAERGVFLQGDAVLAAEGFGAQELDAGDAVGDDLELLDLVLEPADLGLFQFLAAELLGLVDADLADAVDGLAAVVQAAAPRTAAGRRPRRRRRSSTSSKTPRRRPWRGRCSRRRLAVAVAHLGQDLLDHVADQVVGDLHGVISSIIHHKTQRAQRTKEEQFLPCVPLCSLCLLVNLLLPRREDRLVLDVDACPRCR